MDTLARVLVFNYGDYYTNCATRGRVITALSQIQPDLTEYPDLVKALNTQCNNIDDWDRGVYPPRDY